MILNDTSLFNIIGLKIILNVIPIVLPPIVFSLLYILYIFIELLSIAYPFDILSSSPIILALAFSIKLALLFILIPLVIISSSVSLPT